MVKVEGGHSDPTSISDSISIFWHTEKGNVTVRKFQAIGQDTMWGERKHKDNLKIQGGKGGYGKMSIFDWWEFNYR